MNQVILLWSFGGLLNVIFPIISIDYTLVRRQSKVKTYITWAFLALFCYLVFIFWYRLNLFDDTRSLFTGLFILIIGTVILYIDTVECKVFVSLGLYLCAIVITFMFCGTTDTILGAKLGLFDETYGPYTVQNIVLFIIVKIIVFIPFHIFYIRLLSQKIKEMLFHAKSKMRIYLLGPALSLLGFFMIMYTTNSIGIVPASFYFFMLYVPVCTVFVIEFIHIYMSVRWATEAIKASKLVRMDSLTGLYNKTAFSEIEENYNNDIKAGNAAFAVVVLDLNYLKKINDSYGHEKGDIALKTMADSITRVFKDCKCFRIGGDEFAVTVFKDKIADLGDMINEFYDLLENNKDAESWKHISAAAGYCVYTDEKDFRIVFNKADKQMYDNKVQMKAQRT